MVKTLIRRNYSGFLLMCRKCFLRFLQVVAQRFGLLPKPDGVLTCWLHLELKVDINVGLRKTVGYRCRKIGIAPAEFYVNDIALPRRPDVELSLQQVCQPNGNLPIPARSFHPLLSYRSAFVHA